MESEEQQIQDIIKNWKEQGVYLPSSPYISPEVFCLAGRVDQT